MTHWGSVRSLRVMGGGSGEFVGHGRWVLWKGMPEPGGGISCLARPPVTRGGYSPPSGSHSSGRCQKQGPLHTHTQSLFGNKTE